MKVYKEGKKQQQRHKLNVPTTEKGYMKAISQNKQTCNFLIWFIVSQSAMAEIVSAI